MSHQATTRRSALTAPTSLECPLASLGRNSSAVLDSLNGHHHQPPYHHPLSSSPLDPQVYQMSRKSPDLSIDADDIIYTSSVSQQANDDLIANIDEIEDDASAEQRSRCLTEMYERPRINSSSQSNGTGEAIVADKTPLSSSLGRSGPQRAPPLPSTQRNCLLLDKKFHCRDEPPSGVYQRSRESPDLEGSRLSSSSQQVGDQIDIHRANDDDIAEDSSDAAHRSHVRRAEMYQLSRSSSRSSLEQGMKPRKSSTFELRSRHDMSGRMCASPGASPTTAPRQQQRVPPPSQQMNYFVLEQLLQYGRSNERTPSAYLLHGNNADTEDSSDAAGCGTGMRLTRHQGGRCSVPIVSSNGGRSAQYQLEKKMDTMYLESALRGLPLGSEASHFQNERYYLEDGLRNMCDYSSGNGRRSDSHLLHHRASSTSETSSSERYLLNRSNSPSKGFTSSNHHLDNFANSNGNTNNNSSSSSNLVLDPRFDHSKVKSLSDGLYNLGRFSPSLDQGYATLVSPSPTGHHPNTITTHSIVHHPPATSTLTTSTARRHAESGPPPWNKKGPLRSGPYFDRLPDEAIVRVFNWLDSCELCSVARTCRRFEQVAWRPVLWKVIALKGEHLNGDKTLKMIIRQLCGQSLNGSCPEVERVMLSDGCRISDKGLQLVSRRCPELTHLQLQTCMNVTNQALMDVLSKCTNLQHLDVTGCSQVTSISPTPNMEPPRRLLLQYLDLTDCMAIDDVGLKTVVKNCPQLVYLYLRRCIQITDAGLKFVPSFCLALKELSVSDCTNITDFGLYELAKLGAALRYLSVAKCDRVSDAGLKVIARRCYKLRYLNARGCEAVSDDSITFLARSCPRLRALDIGKCDVSDAGLRALAESCPNLKKLSLRNCDMITDRGVQCIAYYCRGLQQLNIQDCQISIEGYRAVKKYCKRCIIEHTNPGFC